MNSYTHDRDEDVRGWLRGEGEKADARVSAFDPDRTIRRARIRRRRHGFAAAGAAGLVVVALLAVPVLGGRWWSHTADAGVHPAAVTASAASPVPSASSPAPLAGPTTCAIVDLPVPSGLKAFGVAQPSKTFMTGVDPSGAYVIGNAFDKDYYTAAVILWHDRVPTILPTRGLGHMLATTYAVNSHGVVAGTGEAPGAIGFAWVYRNGTATRLPNVPGYDRLVEVYGVDEAGDVLGTELTMSGDHSIVVVWPASSPQHPQIQSALTDRLGTMVGAGYDGNGRLYAWSETDAAPSVMTADGQEHELALPAGYHVGGVAGLSGSWAYGVVFRTHAVAKIARRDPADEPLTVRWDLTSGSVVVIPGTQMDSQDTLPPVFVAAKGTPGFIPYDGRFTDRVFVLAGGGGTPTPVGISDDGSTIAGWIGPAGSQPYEGKTRPVLWHC